MSDQIWLDLLYVFLSALYYAIPSWLANISPVFFGSGKPIDRGKTWSDGKPIFGKNKTQRGLVAAILAGIFGGIVMLLLYNIVIPPVLTLLQLPQWPNPLPPIVQRGCCPTENKVLMGIVFGFLMGFGAMTGDLCGSFIKRRKGIQSGQSFIPMDQVGFIICSMIFAFPYAPAPLAYWIVLLPFTFITHIMTNLLGYILKITDVPL